MSQRQRLMTTPKPIHEENNNIIPNTAVPPSSSLGSDSSKESSLIMTSMSSLIEKPTSKPNLEEKTLASGDKRKVMDDIEKKSADIESSTSNTKSKYTTSYQTCSSDKPS